MIIFIDKITHYRDGGTISIQGFFQGFSFREICIKCSSFNGDNSVWFGYPNKENSVQITDSKIIETLKKEVENFSKSVENYKNEILTIL